MGGVLLRILKKEGVLGTVQRFRRNNVEYIFYACVIHLSLSFPANAPTEYAYFFFYSMVRTSYLNRLAKRLPRGSKAPQIGTAMELILGAIAGALAQIFTIPVSVIATRQQVGRTKRQSPVSSSTDLSEPPEDDSFLGVAREIVEEEGIGGLWLGIKPGLILTVNPAITYGAYERVKSIVVLAKGTASMSPGLSFIVRRAQQDPRNCCMFISCNCLVFFPFNVPIGDLPLISWPRSGYKPGVQILKEATVKHLDVPHSHEYHHKQYKHPGALDILLRVWRTEGFSGWYQVYHGLNLSRIRY